MDLEIRWEMQNGPGALSHAKVWAGKGLDLLSLEVLTWGS